jgi:hypothetical protein
MKHFNYNNMENISAEDFFEQKFGNKLKVTDSWVIRFAEEYATLKLSESKQQLPVVKDLEYDTTKSMEVRSRYETEENTTLYYDKIVGTFPDLYTVWLEKQLYYSPQVVKDGFEKLREKFFLRFGNLYAGMDETANEDVIFDWLIDNISSNFSPQVSPSDEEIIVSFQSIRFQYENNPNFTPKDVVNNLRTLFSEVK